MKHNVNAGFSTVELLIALFIAATFIATASQLFLFITKSGGESRSRAESGGVAYESIQLYSHKATNPCAPVAGTENITRSELPGAKIAVSFSCPYGDNSRVTRITAVVEYDNTNDDPVTESLDVFK